MIPRTIGCNSGNRTGISEAVEKDQFLFSDKKFLYSTSSNLGYDRIWRVHAIEADVEPSTHENLLIFVQHENSRIRLSFILTRPKVIYFDTHRPVCQTSYGRKIAIILITSTMTPYRDSSPFSIQRYPFVTWNCIKTLL